MTLAAIKKLAIQLPVAQRMKLADALYESVPALPGSVGLAELERRADEVLSGKVKPVSGEQFDRDLRAFEKSVRQKRSRQRG